MILSIFLSLLISALFSFLYHNVDHFMVQRLEEQAIAYSNIVNHTKMWNYDFGGVYVEKRRGDETNAHLQKLGLEADLHALNGKSYTVRNHAIMLNEISHRSEAAGGVRFRMVSPAPIDQRNRPDPLETEALEHFARGEKKFFRLTDGPFPQYRYVLPIPAEESCRQCHREVKAGALLGGLSITIPVTQVMAESRADKRLIVFSGAVILASLLLVLFLLTWRLTLKLDAMQLKLRKQATTDELTGLRNRRKILQRLDEEFLRAARNDSPLSLIILDIDHFKQINDRHGHPFGDIVLKQIAVRMSDLLRSYDLVGRIGGEEFLIITPQTDRIEALVIAERIRQTIADESISEEQQLIHLTISAGVTEMLHDEDTVQTMIKRADTALYKAKSEGRNRVAAV